MAVSPVSPALAIAPLPGAASRLPQPGEDVAAVARGPRADGKWLLQGEGWQCLLDGWPEAWPALASGDALRLRVLSLQPVLQLAWLAAAKPAAPVAAEEGAGLARALLPEAALQPRLQPREAAPSQLAEAWHAALQGQLRQIRQRFQQQGGQAVSALLLPQWQALAQADAPQPGLPLWLPFWLWGGPRLAMWLERPDDDWPPPDETLADLLLELELPFWGRLRLRLRRMAGGVWLGLSVDEARCAALRQRKPALAAAAARAGVRLLACGIGPQPRLRGEPLEDDVLKLDGLRYLPPPSLFAVAAELLLCLREPDEG
ncbi:hypothetical protein CEK28_04235 [Xenophilus sp. AP218F]|nr:hypothetical protein CEK28_04235 [Xenophilus sp. AP218F]